MSHDVMIRFYFKIFILFVTFFINMLKVLCLWYLLFTILILYVIEKKNLGYKLHYEAQLDRLELYRSLNIGSRVWQGTNIANLKKKYYI